MFQLINIQQIRMESNSKLFQINLFVALLITPARRHSTSFDEVWLAANPFSGKASQSVLWVLLNGKSCWTTFRFEIMFGRELMEVGSEHCCETFNYSVKACSQIPQHLTGFWFYIICYFSFLSFSSSNSHFRSQNTVKIYWQIIYKLRWICHNETFFLRGLKLAQRRCYWVRIC